jgi:hypothetical protein
MTMPSVGGFALHGTHQTWIFTYTPLGEYAVLMATEISRGNKLIAVPKPTSILGGLLNFLVLGLTALVHRVDLDVVAEATRLSLCCCELKTVANSQEESVSN